MYKVLVVEDMDLTRQDIVQLIEWEKYGFELLPDARNGKIGLEYARRYEPDIIITDIKMPVMTGLDMVEELKKNGCKAAVILLTAYEEFELAIRALQMGVQTFVLKYEIDEESLLKEFMGKRRTHGHLLWKFNNNSNIISYGVVDYFNEPLRAYYALKRAYEPFQISFSVEDSIGVWVVNDMPVKQEGSVKISLLELDTNKIIKTKKILYTCLPDESIYLGNLDDFGQFKKNTVLIAQAFNLDGISVAFNQAYVEIERRLRFPKEGNLDVTVEKGENQIELVLSCDTFARSVELIGDCQGDTFGWLFQDNYFDLVPGIPKRVKIMGNYKQGTITVKPYYWKKEVKVTIP